MKFQKIRKKRLLMFGEKPENAKGDKKTALLTMPDGYILTAMTAVAIMEKVLEGAVSHGFQTPAKALGKCFYFVNGGGNENRFIIR